MKWTSEMTWQLIFPHFFHLIKHLLMLNSSFLTASWTIEHFGEEPSENIGKTE